MRAVSIFFVLCSLLVIAIFEVSTFNIDTNNPVIYLDQTKYTKYVNPSSKSSFFGLSVILIPGDNIQSAWLQIGAPRGNSPSLQYKNPGIIFRCTIPNPCEYVEVDTEPSSAGRYNNKFDDAWIGATMDVNLKFNRTVVCAPRWINVYRDSRRELDYRMLGACYWANLNSRKYHKRMPLLGSVSDYIYKDRATNESVYNWGQGEAGVSVHMPEDAEEMFIGAPGVFNWKGTTLIYRDKAFKDDSPVANKYRVAGSEEDPEEILNDVNIANARLSGNLFAFGLFGYAVTSGHFYSRKQLHYAGGAPRSQNYRGQVLICHFGENHDQKLNVKDTKEGSQFGEYFGAALAAGDINQDGFDDLFVGAPFYHSSKYNEGRMYLYLGSPKGSLQDPVVGKFIDGTYTNGQFGAAITFLGDMNKDGNRYVAVSAPYAEEGSGVLYIFKGLHESYGIDSNPVQKIIGKDFLPNIRGFGMGISKPADIDANGYKDIAVGAYQSGHVVLLRSRPLVIINTSFSPKPKAISTQQEDFPLDICYEFSSYGGMDTIQISRKIVVDENFDRAELLSAKEYGPFELRKGRPLCESLRIKLRKSLPNAYDPLTVAVTTTFIEKKPTPSYLLVGNSTQGSDNFCIRCGVYDKFRSIQTVEESIPFILGCGNDNVCLSALTFNTSFIVLGKRTNTFVRGSTNVIELETEVKNDGEKAYLLYVQVDLPKGLSFKKRPPLCEQNRTSMKCPLANPLEEGKSKVLPALKLDMEYVNKKIDEDFLYLNVTLLTNSKNKNEAFQRVKLYLKTEADITISGKSGEQSYAYGNDSNSKVEFEQTYLISKFGASPVNSIAFEIYIPYAIQTKDENITFVSLYQPVGLLEGQSLVFESELPILVVNKFESSEGISSDKIKESREKRDLEFNEKEVTKDDAGIVLNYANLQDSVDSDLLGTATYEINCNRTDVLCGRIYGSAGPFEGSKNSAVLQLRLLLDIKNITGFLQKNSVIQYSTTGLVAIKDPLHLIQSGTRPDMAVVSSIFLNDSAKKKIDTWIIIVSAVLGLLLLLLLTLGLTKAGFFKRAKKEELEQLKAQTGYRNSKMDEAGSDNDILKTE